MRRGSGMLESDNLVSLCNALLFLKRYGRLTPITFQTGLRGRRIQGAG